MPEFDKETIELEACLALKMAIDLPDDSPIRIGDDGVYLKYAGRVFKFQIEVNLVEEVDEAPEEIIFNHPDILFDEFDLS